MSHSIVREAEIQIGLSAKALDREEIQRSVEICFVPSVVEALGQAVRDEFGTDAVLHLRSLDFSHSLWRGELISSDVASALGRELCASLRPRLCRVAELRSLTPTEVEDGVVFSCQTIKLGCWILSWAKSRMGPGEFPFEEFASMQPAEWLQTATARELVPVLEDIVHAPEAPNFLRLVSDELPGLGRRLGSLPLPRDILLWLRPPGSPASQPASEPDLEPGTTEVAIGQQPANPVVPETGQAPASSTARSENPSIAETLPHTPDVQPTKLAPEMEDGARATVTKQALAQTTSLPMPKERTLPRHASIETTAAGGLAYLLKPILELHIAEHLWCAGAPEASVLCCAAQALVPNVDLRDPIFACLFGLNAREARDLRPLPDWAQDEVRKKSALHASEHLLQHTGLAVRAEDILRDCLVAEQAMPAPNLLVGYLAALLRLVLNQRLGRAVEDSLESSLALRATLFHGADATELRMSMNQIDTQVRAAGLDLNPGYVPWLARSIAIVFVPSSDDIV